MNHRYFYYLFSSLEYFKSFYLGNVLKQRTTINNYRYENIRLDTFPCIFAKFK